MKRVHALGHSYYETRFTYKCLFSGLNSKQTNDVQNAVNLCRNQFVRYVFNYVGVNLHIECKTLRLIERLVHFITKASDVQHPDEVGGGLEGEALVYPFDHMVKQAAVHCFGQGIAGIVGLLHLQRNPGRTQSGAWKLCHYQCVFSYFLLHQPNFQVEAIFQPC